MRSRLERRRGPNPLRSKTTRMESIMVSEETFELGVQYILRRHPDADPQEVRKELRAEYERLTKLAEEGKYKARSGYDEDEE